MRTLFGTSGAEFGFDYLQCICLNGSLVPHTILIYVNVELFWLNFFGFSNQLAGSAHKGIACC